MRVAEVMTTRRTDGSPAITRVGRVGAHAVSGIHHLIVMENSKVVGVLSDRDAGGRGAGVRAQSRVEDLDDAVGGDRSAG